LGAPAIEFGHSRRGWALLDGDDLYLSAYCVGLSVLSDTLGFMLSLGLEHTSLIYQKRVQA